jgi:hypothetical protein
LRNAPLLVPVFRGALCAPPRIGLFYRGFEPHLDEMQHAPVNDPTRHRLHELEVRDAVEIARYVGIDNFPVAGIDKAVHFIDGIERVAARTVGILFEG